MNNDFCRNAGLHAPPQHLDAPSSSSLTMTNWNFVPSAMEVDGQDHQCSLFRQNWPEPSMAPEQSIFESALSSLVSSPGTATNSGDSFMIGELIGKLGNIGNSCGGEFLPSCSSSCYSTPLNSPPPKLTFPPAIDQTIPSLSQTTPLGPTMAAPELAADPGFAERAARFSRLGSRSFHGRTTPFSSSNTSDAGAVLPNGKMPRVGSTAVGSQDESTVSQQIPSGAKFSGAVPRKRKSFPGGKAKESSVGASPSNNAGKEGEVNTDDAKTKRSKSKEKEKEKEKETEKAEDGEKQSKSNDEKPPAEPPKDYIHVRARRGQATDSHSLAERVRREKISERMKLLQNLVPGCNKVTGKALMLDEIINYVQSLQRQVEFLSMKLASVDTRLDINVDSLRSKNIIQANNYSENGIFQYDSSATMVKQPTSNPLIPMHQFDHSALRPMPLPPPQNLPQSFYEDDLQTIVHMGLRQKQDFYDSNQMPITDTNP